MKSKWVVGVGVGGADGRLDPGRAPAALGAISVISIKPIFNVRQICGNVLKEGLMPVTAGLDAAAT